MSRPAFRFACAAALAASTTAACTDPEPTAPVVDSGAYHTYVQTGWELPTTQDQARDLGFDVDDDGMPDNQGGALVSALGGIGLDLTGASATAFASGDVVTLHRLRADALTDDDSVSWEVLVGQARTTPPRFDGSETFAIAGSGGALVGAIGDGHLAAADGTIVIRVPFFPGQHPVPLPLTGAQLEVDLSNGGCRGRIGGVLRASDRDLTVLPIVAEQAIGHMAAHPEHRFTVTAIEVFDRDHDGAVTAAEITRMATSVFVLDVDLDADDQADGMSIALGFTCAPATAVTLNP